MTPIKRTELILQTKFKPKSSLKTCIFIEQWIGLICESQLNQNCAEIDNNDLNPQVNIYAVTVSIQWLFSTARNDLLSL